MKVKRFEELESWKAARELVKNVYCLTRQEEFSKDYGLKDQIQRASVSIMANISEGFDSETDKAFYTFLSYSYRSASEVESLLYVALDLKYIQEDNFNELYNNLERIKSLVAGLKRYLSKSLSS